jgi:hypothetical protein
MVRTFTMAIALLTAACGNKDKDREAPAAGPELSLADPTCRDADSCVAECDDGVLAACALASTIYGLGYKVAPDDEKSRRYRKMYLDLRTRACAKDRSSSAQCQDSAPTGEKPDWAAIRDECRAGKLNSCLRCVADGMGLDCSRVPP